MKSKIITTKRNEDLAPQQLGSNLLMGYVAEIHDEDAFEFVYKLPIGAIKRLIRSYLEDMESIDIADIYQGSTGSWEIRMYPYCNRMLRNIEDQLSKHGFEGRKIIDEVFNQFFKKSYDEMRKYTKNHPLRYETPCNDPKCSQCLPITNKPKEQEEHPLIKQVKILIATVNKIGFEKIEIEQAYQSVFKELLNLLETAFVRLSRRKTKA